MSELRELYEALILDHNRQPRNFRVPAGCNHRAHGLNPLCGDDITLYLRVRDGLIEDIGFQGHGCAISTASASLMTERLLGKGVAEAQQLFHAMHAFLTGEPDTAVDPDRLGKLCVLAGVHAFPARVKCATLPWHTLHAALTGGARVSTE